MLPKFSVKKPFTVLVSVILVLVLGFVSVTKMTPDLLPEMSFPYVILFTPYPGASPEEVEQEVTKPMEQAMAALDDITEVTSTSSENVSVVFLTFDDGTNIDTALIDVHQNISALEGTWDEMVGSTTVLELSTNLVPTVVASVAMEGMSNIELSEFVNDTLMMDLEGINGVASVTTSGIVSRTIEISPDREKIDALNEQIYGAIDEKFSEASAELEDARAAIEEGEAALAEGREQLENGQNALNAGKHEAREQFDAAEAELTAMKTELLTAKEALLDQQEQLTAQSEELVGAIEALTGLQYAIRVLEGAQAFLDASIEAVKNDPNLTEEQKAVMIEELQNGQAAQELRQQSDAIDAQLASFGLSRDTLDESLNEMTAGLSAIEAGLAEIESALAEIDSGLAEIDSGNVLLEEQRAEAEKLLRRAQGALTNAKTELEAGEQELITGKEQLEAAEELAQEQLEAAKEAANLHNILTKEVLSQLLSAQNFSMPAGYLSDGETQWVVTVGDEIDGIAELNDLVLFSPEVGDLEPIRLSDIATITIVDNADTTYAKINGQNGVLLSFTKQSSYATKTVSDHVAERFAELESEYEGLDFVALMDQGDFIQVAMDSVVQNLLIGAALAILILLLFLRDLRPTLVVGISIPVSVLFALVLMYFSGVTMNIISMAGLAIGIGMLVDNSIVVIENIYRLRADGLPVREAAVTGAKQVLGAITASTLTTICVFLPILFVQGLTRQIFMDMVLTVTFSLVASLIVALTVVPAMVTGVMRRPVKPQREASKKFLRAFEVSIRFVLKHRGLALLLSLVILLTSVFLCLRRGFILFPESGGTQLSVTVTIPEDTEFEQACEIADAFVAALESVEELTDVGAMLGNGTLSAIGLDSSERPSEISLYALLDESGNRSNLDIESDVRAALAPFEGIYNYTIAGMSTMGLSGMSGEGISIRVYANDTQVLSEAAAQIAAALKTLDGIIEIDDSLGKLEPALHVSVDRTLAMENGLTVAQVFMEISSALSDSVSGSDILVDGTGLDAVIKTEQPYTSAAELEQLTFSVEQMDGTKKTVTLSDIASVEETTSLTSISRENQRRCVTVSAAVDTGYNVTLVSAEARNAVDALSLPNGCSIAYAGESEDIMSAMSDLFWMLLLGILIIYLIMVAQFQSLLSPFIILGTLPLAFAGGFIALLIANMELSIVAMVGLIMLVGIAVNNGIVLVDTANQLHDQGDSYRDAVVKAASMRLRPVLMTALTTILGLLPLAIGFGTGAEIIQPVAVVCIGGLTYATVMTMYIIPVMYDLLRRDKKSAAKIPNAASDAETAK